MKKILLLVLIAAVLIFIVKTTNKDMDQDNTKVSVQEKTLSVPEITPISHASLLLNWDSMAIYADPVGADKLAGRPEPDLILLTDIHGDHLDVEALKSLAKEKTVIIAPMAVADMLPAAIPGTLLVMTNNQKSEQLGFSIEAIPMYNLPEAENADRHPKGRGNGYVIEKNGTRIYISGDTAGIPEMRNLQDIDMAFVAMNLPYTMGVEEAADAVLAFKPRKVYPYHYRTPEGFSDIAKFRQLVESANVGVEVVELAWY